MVDPVGFEPTTKGLRVLCSTAELQIHRLRKSVKIKQLSITTRSLLQEVDYFSYTKNPAYSRKIMRNLE